ncbi:DNA-binding protein [Schaalia sp. ZJ405]|uniref:DNA-binding protein n=1 Tax=Schaalia sp. ZJ405 TaxID=2709403 RepID=UPI0013EC008E|nr:DNA-binding protein [Schaalia sp. ZJ405]
MVRRWNEDPRIIDEAEDEDRTRSSRGTTAIRQVRDRQHATLFGSVLSMTYPPAGSTLSLAATLYDGTGSIELRWPGRRDIPGLSVGAHLEVEGTAGFQGDHLVIINPAYRIIAMESE